MKNFLILLFFGLIGGSLGGYFFSSVNDKYFASVSQVEIATPSPSPVLINGNWENVISESSPGLVGIQIFQSDRLVKQGSGIVVSSDGLIITIADLAVPRAVYQIYYDGKILRGTVAAVDYNQNLLLLRTEESFANVVEFTQNNFQNGQEIVAAGKLIDLSNPVLFSQKGTISYITEKNIVIDTVLNINNLSGAGAINESGDIMGIIFSKNGKVQLVRASLIEDFFQKNMSKEAGN